MRRAGNKCFTLRVSPVKILRTSLLRMLASLRRSLTIKSSNHSEVILVKYLFNSARVLVGCKLIIIADLLVALCVTVSRRASNK